MALDPNSSQRERKTRPDTRVACVVSRFHDELTGAMLRSAIAELGKAGVDPESVRVSWVPGSFELPLVARRGARVTDAECVLAIGFVLKGETRHDEYVAQATTQGLVSASMQADKPIMFGVLTCDTLEQARDRALSVDEGGKEDKGREIARAAIDVLCTLDEVAQTKNVESIGFGSAGAKS